MHTNLYLPTANEVWGKVMFLHLSVSHSVHSGHRVERYASYWNAYLFLFAMVDPGFSKEGVPTPADVTPYYLAIFFQKLHDNEINWTKKGCMYLAPHSISQ